MLHEHPVLGVIALFLPERPHLVDPGGHLGVGEGGGLGDRDVVQLEGVGFLDAAAAFHRGEDAFAVVVADEGFHGAQTSRRRLRWTWSSSRATSDWDSVAPVFAVRVSGMSAST